MDLLKIAIKLKELRKQQELTVAQLAEKSGFSKAFISRVENFRITPSLGALNKIATALGIEIADLFQDNNGNPEYLFCHLDEGEPIVRDKSDKFGMKYFSLAFRKPDRKMNPFIIEYHQSNKPRPMLRHDNDEFFLLLEGKVDFFITDTTNRKRLTGGDTVYLSKNMPHTVSLAEGETYARARVVYSS